MKDLILKNIYLLIPIFLLSVYSFTLICKKIFYFNKIRIRSQKRIGLALEHLIKGEYSKALGIIKKDQSPTAEIIKYECKLLGEGDKTVFIHKVEAFAQRIIFRMEKSVSFLSLIANIATLLGLLGTVIGMIYTFYTMMITESSDPYSLAGGISQALVTTAAGLITAIPAMLFYTLFNSIIRRHISSMESSISEILAIKE